MNARIAKLRKAMVELLGEDNIIVRIKLHERLTERELKHVVMLATRRVQEDWFQFIAVMDRTITLLNETTATARKILEDLKPPPEEPSEAPVHDDHR